MLLYLLHVADRWLSILRYGRGVQFVAPSATALQSQLRMLARYGVRTYAYTFTADGYRAYRVRSQQERWALYVLDCAATGRTPRAWSDKHPNAAARPVGWAGAILSLFGRR